MGRGISAPGKEEHLILPQKFFYGDYFFVYTSDDNNDVVLIQPTPEIADIPGADMPD